MMATLQSVKILTDETTYVRVIMMDWSRHVPSEGFQPASIGLHLARATLNATRLDTTVRAMRPQSI